MRKIAALVATIALAGCVTTGPYDGVKSLGGDSYMVSEISGFGNVVERAAVFCSSFGQTMQITGNTMQTGIASGNQYAVITFRCVSSVGPN